MTTKTELLPSANVAHLIAEHAGYSITQEQARYLHADAMLKAREGEQ